MKRALLIFLAILALSGIAYAAEQVIRGDLTVTGDFSVTGDTTYTGDLIVKGGDLTVGEAGTEPGDIVLHDAGTITMYDDGNDTSFIWGPVANGTTTLGGTGNLDISGTIDAGTMTLGSGSITDSSGAISFGDEALTTTGALAAATLNTGQGAYELYAMNQDMETTDSPTFVTAKLSGLTDTYIPYHVADATGLADSPLKRTDANTVTFYSADPTFVFDGSTASDTDFWMGLVADEDGVDDDKFQIGKGTTPGTTPYVTVDKDGNIGIGTTAPSNQLEVTKTAIGATPVDTNGIRISNTTDAAAGAQQYSPPLVFRGSGWKTDATAASQKVEFMQDVRPVQGTSAPTGYWGVYPSINDAAYSATPAIAVTSEGKVGIGTTAPVNKLEVCGDSYFSFAIRRGGGTAWNHFIRYNGTLSSPTIVLNNDILGGIAFVGSNGVGGTTPNAAIIQAEVDGEPGATDMPGRLTFLTTPDGTVTALERVRINNAGNVGIGTTGPDARLEVNHATGDCLQLTYNDGDGSAANHADFTVSATGDLTVAPSGGDAYITGDVGISTANITAGSGTGITVNHTGRVNQHVYKVTTTYAAYADTDTTKGIVVATLPAKTKIISCYADTTTPYTGGAVSAATLRVGVTAEDAAQIIASHDVLSGAVTKGLADADMGTSMTRAVAIQGGYLPSWSGTTAIYATINTTDANTNALTAGSTTFYLVTERY